MKETRLLAHYLRRLAATNYSNGNYFRRLSVLRGQIQKQTRYTAMGFVPYLSLQSSLRQRIAQWPLGLSYFNRMNSWSKFQYNVRGAAEDLVGSPKIMVDYFSKTIKSGNEGMEHRKERYRQRVTTKIQEKKESLIKDLHETKEQMRQKVDHLIHKENIYTVPNLICCLRIGMTPVLGYMILNHHYSYAIGIFAAAGISDFLDGYIARNFPGQSSVLGSVLDPLADKILVATLFLTLTYVDLIPVPLTALIIARDAVLIGAGFVIRYKSLEKPRTLAKYFDVAHPTAQLAPTLISKVNTGVQLGLVGFTLASTIIPHDTSGVLTGLVWLTASTTFASGVSYIFARDTIKILRKKKGAKSESKQKESSS